jgi:nitrogen fixation protein FixH
MKQPEKTRSWWPMGIIAGLGVVFVANAIMITFALTNPSVMVSEDPYGDALAYDEVIAERDAAKALGWTVTLSACSENACTVSLVVRDAGGAPVDGLTGAVHAERGDDAGLDREAEVVARGEGRYEATLALARPGLYEVSVRFHGGPAPWVGVFTQSLSPSEGGRSS